jgi:aspartyl protease family protein
MLPDNPDDQARFFYLAILGLVLASSFLFGQRQRFSKTVRDVAIWALIFVMVMIAYGFRDTLRSALFPSETVMMADGSIALGRGADGHFYASMKVNGQPIRFMVDTGASDIVLSHRDAEKAGIDVDGLNFFGTAQTANGTIATARVRLGLVEFGGATETGVSATVGSGALDTSLLGMAYLDRFSRLEITGDQMILHR